jgi:hypothetical protein
MASRDSNFGAEMDGVNIGHIGQAERGEEFLDRGRSYKGYLIFRPEEIEGARECFRSIRENSLQCNGARNAGKEEYLPPVPCPIAARIYDEARRRGAAPFLPIQLKS